MTTNWDGSQSICQMPVAADSQFMTHTILSSANGSTYVWQH